MKEKFELKKWISISLASLLALSGAVSISQSAQATGVGEVKIEIETSGGNNGGIKSTLTWAAGTSCSPGGGGTEVTTTYSWSANTSGTWAPIEGATSDTLGKSVVDSFAGKEIMLTAVLKKVVTTKGKAGAADTVETTVCVNNSSSPLLIPSIESGDTAPTISGVTITGTAKVGQTLTGSATILPGKPTLTTTTYKWFAGTDVIPGAVTNKLELLASLNLVGKVITLEMTVANTKGSNSAVSALGTLPVAPEVEEQQGNSNNGPKLRAEKSKLVGTLGKPNVGGKKSAVADFLASLNLPAGAPVTFTWMYFVDGEWKPVPNSGSMDYQIEYYLAGHKMKLQVNTGSEIIESEETEIVSAPVVVKDPSIDASNGEQAAGKEVGYQAAGLKIGSEYTVVVRSTPQVISSGVVGSFGSIVGQAKLPKGLEAGWHSITLSGVNYLGEEVTNATWFKLSASGVIIAMSDEEPSTLAATGVSLFGMNPEASLALILGLLLMMAGAGGLTLVRRRQN